MTSSARLVVGLGREMRVRAIAEWLERDLVPLGIWQSRQQLAEGGGVDALMARQELHSAAR